MSLLSLATKLNRIAAVATAAEMVVRAGKKLWRTVRGERPNHSEFPNSSTSMGKPIDPDMGIPILPPPAKNPPETSHVPGDVERNGE